LWPIEVAQSFPGAIVTGIDLDLDPVLPTRPSNCRFVEGDLTKDLDRLFPAGSVDFVHSRLALIFDVMVTIRNLNRSIRQDQWASYIGDLFRCLKPGGWIQCAESGAPFWDDTNLPKDEAWEKVLSGYPSDADGS
jgi:hypothetical protein